MRELTIPAFDEKCSDYKESRNARSVYIPNAGEDSFANYCELLEKNDFVKREETTCERTLYAAYQKDRCGVFLNYFCCTGELLIVIEEACNYFSYTDKNFLLPQSPVLQKGPFREPQTQCSRPPRLIHKNS